ncbi:hypothetical protein XENTR_v10002154 [Xenopus tropicalis]|nr:hypothetical protein XENTR_v10002154 [Xenopus tropicalis]
MLSSKICFRQLRALASLAPTVSQLDNTSDFLAHVPHRKHPGVINLKVVQLPKEAQDAAKVLLQGSTIRDLQGHVNSLNNFLWSRKRPAEDKDLRVRAEELEKKFRASVGCDAETESFEQQEKLRNRVLNTLRKNIYHWQPMSYTEELSLVYFAARFDGGYAAVTRALKEIHQRCPEFKPQTLLDFGSGTGSVTWAANNLWGKSLVEYMCVDSAAPMNRLSELVLKGGSESGEMHISGVYFRQFLPLSPKVQYDLVVSAFSLTDLPSLSEREKVVQALWRKTGGFLVCLFIHLIPSSEDALLKVLYLYTSQYEPMPNHFLCAIGVGGEWYKGGASTSDGSSGHSFAERRQGDLGPPSPPSICPMSTSDAMS